MAKEGKEKTGGLLRKSLLIFVLLKEKEEEENRKERAMWELWEGMEIRGEWRTDLQLFAEKVWLARYLTGCTEFRNQSIIRLL